MNLKVQIKDQTKGMDFYGPGNHLLKLMDLTKTLSELMDLWVV
jgi:hypothetical protein